MLWIFSDICEHAENNVYWQFLACEMYKYVIISLFSTFSLSVDNVQSRLLFQKKFLITMVFEDIELYK